VKYEGVKDVPSCDLAGLILS